MVTNVALKVCVGAQKMLLHLSGSRRHHAASGSELVGVIIPAISSGWLRVNVCLRHARSLPPVAATSSVERLFLSLLTVWMTVSQHGRKLRHYATSVCLQHNPCRDPSDYVLAAARDNTSSSSFTRVFVSGSEGTKVNPTGRCFLPSESVWSRAGGTKS